MLTQSIQSQISKDSLYNVWKNTNKPDSIRANAFNNLILTKYINNKTDSAYIFAKELQKFTIDKKLKLQQADVLNTLGNIQMLIGEYQKATDNYFTSLDIYKIIGDKKGEATILNNIGRMYKQNYNLDKALEYYNMSLLISQKVNDIDNISKSYTNIGNVYNFRFKLDIASEFYEKSLKLSRSINDYEGEAITLINLGQNFAKQKNYKKSYEYLNEGYEISKQINNLNIQMNTLNMLSVNYLLQKKAELTIKYAKMGLGISTQLENPAMQRNFHYTIYRGYKLYKKPKLALEYLEKSNSDGEIIEELSNTKLLQKYEISIAHIKDSLLQIQKEIIIKSEHQIEIQQKNKEKQTLFYGWAASILALFSIGFLAYKNNKRKHQIIEKERVIEKQKLEKVLKDQELNTINAMIEGQEKERQRLANELHDSVGATLSAARLQFEHLQKHGDTLKNKDELFTKTSKLLEEAYQEIRSMAHAKNSGVIAKFGLLPAIEKLAKNISVSSLNIKVEDFGLNERIDNTLEITIFRIIQELVTNIIKHSKATQASISLTQYNNNLNIIIEDNGIGFDSKKIINMNGMGLSSIEKRIENLEGNFEIDSTSGKGTNILIDIPI